MTDQERRLYSHQVTTNGMVLSTMTEKQRQAFVDLVKDSRWSSSNISLDTISNGWLYVVMGDGYTLGISPEGSVHS